MVSRMTLPEFAAKLKAGEIKTFEPVVDDEGVGDMETTVTDDFELEELVLIARENGVELPDDEDAAEAAVVLALEAA